MSAPPPLPADVLARSRELLDRIAESRPEPTAMTLATADADGHPSTRTVLLKELDERGFVFYTNLMSRKGRQLAENPWASVTFFRAELGRQLHAEGPVTRVTEEEADAYWITRARESRIGAWASLQSSELSGRAELEERVASFTRRFEGGDVPRPEHWSGYRLSPLRLEIWSAGDFRLHDRECWTVQGHSWRAERLFP